MANVGRLVKESSVRELSSSLEEQPDFLITTVNRLPAAEADRLRRQLSGSRARLLVVKRTLGCRTVEHLNLSGASEGIVKLLEGTVGFVLPGDDVLPAAKTIVEFIKAHEDQLAVRGAFIDGQLLDKSRVEQLASLPPKPVLLAQVLATIESSISQLIFTVEQLIGDVIWAADEAAGKKPTAAEATVAPTTVETAAPTTASESAKPTDATSGAPSEPAPPVPESSEPPTAQEGTPA